ncbi:MAG: DUF2235 domain-containing protein, partial [Candidatus Electrothrix sp. AUS4]|nr:DUF2235 domain-containing protein [Candidatus Electrothrix sp. AUS4]
WWWGGAYTVRCVANVMNLCGIPQHDAGGNPIPRYGRRLRAIAEEAVLKVYEHGAGHKRDKYEPQREELARRFRKTYGSEGVGRNGEPQGNVQPYFIGVFDTVAALGQTNWRKFLFYLCPLITFIIGLIYIISTGSWSVQAAALLILYPLIVFYVAKKRFRYIKDFPNNGNFSWHIKSWGLKDYDRFLDNLVPYARHAISIDENRAAFQRVGWGRPKDYEITATQQPAWMKQVWFPGGHSDVGGSYPENESRLSDITLNWMLEQIKEPGVEYPVIFNEKLLHLFPDSSGIAHCELEILKDKLWPQWWPEKYRFSWSKGERHPGPDLHESVFERLEQGCTENCGSRIQYRPQVLKEHERTKHYYLDEVL